MPNPSAEARAEVFISAVSADLKSARLRAKDALLILGCHPVEQSVFPPEAYQSTVRQMLRAKIAACDAVIHLVGECYGEEPEHRAEGELRRSFTQLEYDIALELKKPLFLFLCDPFDTHQPESEVQRALQAAHRAAIVAGGGMRGHVAVPADLETRIRELQFELKKVQKRIRSLARWSAAAAALALLVGGLILWRVQAAATEHKRLADEHSIQLEEQKQLIEREAKKREEEKGLLIDQIRGIMTDKNGAQKPPTFDEAKLLVAQNKKLTVEELDKAIAQFVERVKRNPDAEAIDKYRAEFAEQHFAAAAKLAGTKSASAAEAFRQQNEAMKEAWDTALDWARREGEAYSAALDFRNAVGAYEKAAELTPRTTKPEIWAEFQIRLANVQEKLGIRCEPGEGKKLLQDAVAAYRAALEVYTRQALPQYWAMTQNNLGNALREMAARAQGAESARLIAEAVASCRAALKVYTLQALPQDWAMTQNNLGNALQVMAARTEGAESAQLYTDAVAAYRAALEVYTRQVLPQAWAMTQHNLGAALHVKATRTEGVESARLYAEAVAAYHAVLEVYSEQTLPQDWASTQNNLGKVLQDMAGRAEGAESARLIAEAVAAYRAALKVRTRQTLPQDWAITQNNLGNALHVMAARTEGAESAHLYTDAVAAYRAALEVCTRQALPQAWAMTQHNLGAALQVMAIRTEGAESARLYAEAVAAYRAALEVRTRLMLPQDWAMTQNNLGVALKQMAARSAGADALNLYAEALQVNDEVLAVQPQNTAVQSRLGFIANGFAWELLTCKIETLRDFKKALPLAKRAAELTKHSDPAVLNTVALAWFENGEVSKAIETEERAIALLGAEVTSEARKNYLDALANYRAAKK